MEERRSRNQFRPFRFWTPSWTNPIGRTRSPIPTRQRLNPLSSSQPLAQAKPMPTSSASRRPTTARKDSQKSCMNVPCDPRDQNGRPPVQSQTTKIKSPSTKREAPKAPVQIQPRSDKQPREAQVKFLSNSQSQLPETISLEKDTKLSSKSSENPVRRRSNLRHVTINAMETTPVESHSNTSTIPFISTKATQQINLEKPEPSLPHNVEDTPKQSVERNSNSKSTTNSTTLQDSDSKPESINIKTQVSSVASNEKERKIAISPVSKDSFTDGKRAIYKEEIKEGLSTLKQTISAAADSGRGRNNGSSVSVVTLAGKNNGASMVIGYDDTNTEPCKESVEAGSSRGVWNRNGGAVLASSINNNVQSINNSAIEQSSCSVRHPGVHMKISNRTSETLASDKPMKPQNTERRTFAPLRGQMTPQEPRIRRRCLRALFMESSESDIESSRKPRRHGCRFSCEEKKKMKNDDRQMPASETGAQANGGGYN